MPVQMQVRKVGQVLHIECKFEMTIYPQNLRYAACFMQNSDDLSSLKREIAIFLSISPPCLCYYHRYYPRLLLQFRLPHDEEEEEARITCHHGIAKADL